MTRIPVNFSAALLAAATAFSCSAGNSTPGTPSGATAAASSASGSAAAVSPASTSPASASRPQSSPNDALVAAADRGRIDGNAAAKTWVIIASDFQCPFCKQWHDESHRPLRDEYVRTGKVRVAYINYPLGQHRHALITAEAAMCAGVQNKFWPYHDALFATQPRWAQMAEARPLLDSLARTIGVEMSAWTQCVEGGKTRPLIRADRDRAASAGVQSTPSFLIGGEILLGSQPLAVLRQVIDAAIAREAGPQRK